MGEEKKDEGVKDEVKQEVKEEEKKEEGEVKEEDEKKEEEESEIEEVEEEAPKATLTDEDKQAKFLKPQHWKDLLDGVLNSNFSNFSIPDKSEGFDEVKYEWDNEAKSKQYLKNIVSEKKITSPMPELQPTEAFQAKMAEFQKITQEYEEKQREFKARPKPEEPIEAKPESEEPKEGEEKK